MVTPSVPAVPVVRFIVVPGKVPSNKGARHLQERLVVAEVLRAVNTWSYTQEVSS